MTEFPLQPFHVCIGELAKVLGAPVEELTLYAAEDDQKGWKELVDGMGISKMEGELVYAAIRHLKPEIVVEVGVGRGVSSAHILAALQTNWFGRLISLDMEVPKKFHIPDELKDRWTFIQGNAETCEWGVNHVDVLFEDSAHTEQSTRVCVRRGLDLGARFVFSHDASNFTSGSEVRRGLDNVFGASNYHIVTTEDSTRGLAFWYKEEH